jgi:hypothetical protein
MPGMFQSSILQLNCNQGFYKKKKKKAREGEEKDILLEHSSFGSDSNLQ